MLQVEIRSERPEDIRAIYDLTKRAFAPMVFAGGNEQDLIDAVRDAGALSISLVAEIGSRIVGHVAFTPAMAADSTPGWYGLGPVAVEPELQRKGIGLQLINEGLGKLLRMECGGMHRSRRSQLLSTLWLPAIPGTGSSRPSAGIFHDLAAGGVTSEGGCRFSSAVFGE